MPTPKVIACRSFAMWERPYRAVVRDNAFETISRNRFTISYKKPGTLMDPGFFMSPLQTNDGLRVATFTVD